LVSNSYTIIHSIDIFFYLLFSDLSGGIRDSEGRELAETRGLDSGEISGRRELPSVAVLRAERWGMLDEIFGTACRGQTRLHRRWRGHMHQPVLQTNPHGERRGEDTFLRFTKLKKYPPINFFFLLVLSSFMISLLKKNLLFVIFSYVS